MNEELHWVRVAACTARIASLEGARDCMIAVVGPISNLGMLGASDTFKPSLQLNICNVSVSIRPVTTPQLVQTLTLGSTAQPRMS